MKWLYPELDDVVGIRTGTLNPGEFPTEEFVLFSIPGFDKNQPELLVGEAIKSNKTVVQPGDVLFSKLNPRIPRVWIVPPASGRRQISSTEFWPLVCRECLLEVDYLRFFLAKLAAGGVFTDSIEAATKSRSRIKPFQLLAHRIPLAPVREQRRIVELLEQADELRRQHAEADALADRILPAVFCHFFGEPTANPKGWPTSSLHNLADFISGATPSKENPEYWDGKIPWVSPKDMKQSELHNAIDHVTEKALEETNLKLIPADTALIVVRGMILAHTVPVCLARVPVTINQDMKALSPRGEVTAEFLQWALLTQQSVLLRLVTTAAHGTRKLDTDALGALEIPVPPPARKYLIDKWTHIVREQQALARKRTACGDSVDKLWRVLLHRAFTGELTAKWREAHLKELLAEMEQQARFLRQKPPPN